MSKRITLMIIPEGRDKVFSRTVSSSLFKLVIVLVTIWLIFLVGVTVVYTRLAGQAARSAMLDSENRRLRDYFSRVVDIEKSFKKNQELTSRLAEMAGVDLGSTKGQPEINFDSLKMAATDTQNIPQASDSTSPVAVTPEQLLQQQIPGGRPLYGWITRPFVSGDDSTEGRHTGIDFAVKEGTPVNATASGIVLFAGWDPDLGNLVIIDHQNGYLTMYGHNKKLLVQKGDIVLKGNVIALSGNTGHSSAPHLHYEITKDGNPVDPNPFID